jgi:hypothetical protein
VPLDPWAVTAILEADGLRDADARERFGYPSLFAFARAVFRKTRAAFPTAQPLPPEDRSKGRWVRLVTHLVQGSFFAIPLVGQALAVLLTGHSLTASLGFTPAEATVVGLATVASFLVTGGVVVALGRQGNSHRDAGAFTLLRRSAAQLVVTGLALTVLVAFIGLAAELLSPFTSGPAFPVLVAYFLELSTLWLALAVLYVLRMHGWTLVLTAGGALLVAPLARVVSAEHTAQLVAIGLTAWLSYLVAWRKMGRLVRQEVKRGGGAVAPTADALAGMLAPYGAYGLGYFALLFVDRVLAWTAPGRHAPAPVWFDGAYELPMDWALVSLLLPLAYLEHLIHEFNQRVERDQYGLELGQIAAHRAAIGRFLQIARIKLVAVSSVSVAATWYGGAWLIEQLHVPVPPLPPSGLDTRAVFWIAAGGYQLLTWGLLVGLLHFTLGRPSPVVRAVWRGLGVSALVGFALSRALGAPWAAVGFAAGALVFAVDMMREMSMLSSRVDFYYYAAF